MDADLDRDVASMEKRTWSICVFNEPARSSLLAFFSIGICRVFPVASQLEEHNARETQNCSNLKIVRFFFLLHAFPFIKFYKKGECHVTTMILRFSGTTKINWILKLRRPRD